MTLKKLIACIVSVILIGLYFFFIRGDQAGKIVASVVCPLVIGYLIYAYFKEKNADQSARIKESQIIGGSYFESPEWHEAYVRYINQHPFERPKIQDMKKDLLKRYRRREYVIVMFFMIFLMLCTGCAAYMGHIKVAAIGFLLFGYLFFSELYLYTGMPVRRWMREVLDPSAVETSYKNCQMLTYKKNGLGFGTSHLHAFTEKKVYAIDYRLVDGISRKIVRLKSYTDGVYSKDEYKHFAVINVISPGSGDINDIEIELNEYQVQRAIDKLSTYKLGEKLQENLSLEEEKDDETFG